MKAANYARKAGSGELWGHLDGKTLTKIRHSEVGGELLIVGDTCEGAAS
jgi:hypothetical protein